MMRRASTLVTLTLVVSALLACKKKAPATDTGATGTGPASTGAAPVAPAEPAPTPGRFISDLDLARVCNELPMKEAKAYDSAAGRIHPTIVFSRKNDTDKFTKSYDSDFDGWKTDEAKDYELVACVTAKSSTKVKECKFDSKTPVHFLDLEDASYEMVVFETQTGKQVAKKTFELKVDKDCPMIWMFKNERDVKQAEFTQALMGWAKQWVAPKAGGGAADARFVRFVDDDGTAMYYATYTAYNGRAILPQLIETEDFRHFRILTLNGTAVQNKGMALFPRRVGGRFAMLSRQDDENLFLMFSQSPHHWSDPRVILRPSEMWESVKIGNCGSPIETEAGWLVITHGVGPMRKYCIGAALLDLDDPSRVIGRLRQPLLSPEGNEREGYVPNVVYSCGSLLHGRELILPFAISDRASAIASVSLDDLLTALRSGAS